MQFSKRRLGLGFAVLIVAWLFMANSCMRFRLSDREAQSRFQALGVPLQLADFRVNGRVLHYAVTGCDSCTTLLLLHGSPGSWEAFKDYLADSALRRHFRLVSIDRPGFGYSNYGDALPISQQLPLIGALISHLDNRKPLFVAGHSLGGPLAALVAARYPEQVHGLMLLAASVDPAEEKPERWRPFLKAFPFRYLVPGAFRPSNIELWAFKKDVHALPAALHSVRCPVVIIQGMRDPLVPPGNAFFAQQQLIHAPRVRFIRLPDANHFIPWTRFDTLRKAMLQMGDIP